MKAKSLDETFVYKHLNSSGAISNNLAKAMGGEVLLKSHLEEAFIIINKNFKFPLKYKVLEDIEKRNIVMMYSPQNTRVPTALPFFLTKNYKGDIVAVVLVDMYGKMSDDGKTVNIDPKKLYCMLEGAYLAKLYFNRASEMSKRNIIITNGASIYSNMFARVLNKKYALNTDKPKFQKVLFLASKFYLVNILGLADNEMTTNYAMKNIIMANPLLLKEVDGLMKTEDYKDLSTFLQALGREELGLGMSDLGVRSFLEQYINMYDASTLLALEHFAYFVYTIVAVTNGAYINNQYILEDIVDKNGPKIYADLLSVDR